MVSFKMFSVIVFSCMLHSYPIILISFRFVVVDILFFSYYCILLYSDCRTIVMYLNTIIILLAHCFCSGIQDSAPMGCMARIKEPTQEASQGNNKIQNQLSESTQSRHSHFALEAFKVHLTSCLRMSDYCAILSNRCRSFEWSGFPTNPNRCSMAISQLSALPRRRAPW